MDSSGMPFLSTKGLCRLGKGSEMTRLQLVSNSCDDSLSDKLRIGRVWNGQGRLTLYDKRSKLATRKREEQYKLYTYEGEFKNGKFHGKGKKVQIRDSDGGEGFHPGIGSWEYEGEWRNDDMSGQGKLTYTRSGSVYQGSFKSGKPHGQGTFKGGDGQYKEGTWSHGQFREGKIKMRWEDGRVYEGGWAPDRALSVLQSDAVRSNL